MDAISYWQGVLAELGTADSSREQVRTPVPDKAGWEVFHTPVAVQQGTPVDAWHSIINTLTGNGQAAHARVAQGNLGSPCSSSSAALTKLAAAAAAQTSPCGSPGMVRQLFSAHSINDPGHAKSSTDSTPRLQQQGRILFSSAADGSPLRAFSSSPSKHASPWRGPHTGGIPAAAAGSPRAHPGLQRSPSPAASDTQQLADRLNNLRASAESMLQGAGHTAQHDTAYHSTFSASCSRSRAPSLAAAHSMPVAHAVAAAGQQEQPLPRQLFQSPPRSSLERHSGTNSKHASPLQRLLQSQERGQPCLPQQPLYVAAGSNALASSQVNPSHTLGLSSISKGYTAAGVRQEFDPQLQQPLQQQLSGALSKLEQLLASLPDKQPSSDLQQASSSSGTLLAQQRSAEAPSTAAGHELQQAVLLLQQQQTGQLQQQEALQQLVVQQQLLIQQLLPLLNRPGSTQPADSDPGAAAALPGFQAADMSGPEPGSLQDLAMSAAPGQLSHVLQAQEAAAAAGHADGSGSSPRQQHGSFTAAGLPRGQPVLRPAAGSSSQAVAGSCPKGTAESAPASGDDAIGTLWQSPGSVRGGSARAGGMSPRAMQDAAAAPCTHLAVVQAASAYAQQLTAGAAHQGGSSAAATDWAALMRGSDSSSCHEGSTAADHSLRRGDADGSCAGSSAVGRSESGSTSTAGSTRLRRRWHMQPPNRAGPGSELAQQQDLPQAAAVQHQQQAWDGPDGQHATNGDGTITLGQPTAATAIEQATEVQRPAWSAAGSKSLPAAGENASLGHDFGRFASQHARSGPGSLAQQLGLPEVMRGSDRRSSGDAGDAGANGARGHWPGSSSEHGTGSNTEGSRRCSSDGAVLPTAAPAAAEAGELAAAQEALGRQSSASSHGSDVAGTASVASGEGSGEPETPTAALPRVHTPGKAAAEVAAEMTTPVLAHSAAAVMTVTEAWREESNGAQGRWQQLLAEWSASDIDTWEPQRLTEPSAMSAPGSPRLYSAPGLNRTFSTASGAQHSDAGATQEQRQHQHSGHDGRSPAPSLNLSRLATVTGPQQEVLDQQQWVQGATAMRQADGEQQQSEGGAAAEGHEQEQEHEQQPQEQLTFASLAHDFVSPRKMPTHLGMKADRQPATTGAPLEAEGPTASHCTTPQPEQQRQQQQEQQEQSETAPLPSARTWLDTTRKQLFTSAADGASSRSRTSRSSSDSGGSNPSDTRLGGSSAAQRGFGRGSALAPSAPAAENAVLQPMADDGSQQQQQQQLEQREFEELERLDKLLHELQGTVHLAAVTHAAGSTSGGAAAAAASHNLSEPQQCQEGDDPPDSDQSQQQQQQPQTVQACEEQEAEGLQRLGQLLQDIQGLQQSLHSTELGHAHQLQHETELKNMQHSQHSSEGRVPAGGLQQQPTTVWAAGAGAAATDAGQLGAAVAAACTTQSVNMQIAQQGQPAAAVPRDVSDAAHQLAPHQPHAASLPAAAAAAPAGVGAAAVTPPPRLSATLTQSAAASSAMTQLKQRLKDTRAALQAIATPQIDTKPLPSTPHLLLESVSGEAACSSSSTGPQGEQQPAALGQAAAAAAAQQAASLGWAAPVMDRTPAASRSSPLSSLAGLTTAARPATVQQPQQPADLTGLNRLQQQHAIPGVRSAVAESLGAADAVGDVAGAAAAAVGSTSAWLTGGPLQQYLNRRRSSTDRLNSRQAGAAVTGTGLEATAVASSGGGGSSSKKQSWDGDSDAGSSHVQALVRKWRAAGAANVSGQQQQQHHSASGAGVPSWQSLLAQPQPPAVPGWLSGSSAISQGAVPGYNTPPAQLGSLGASSQHSARSSTAAAYTGTAAAATPISGSALTALLQTPPFDNVRPAGQWDGSAGRGVPGAASGGRHSGRSSSLTPGLAAQSHTSGAAAHWSTGRVGLNAPYQTPSSTGAYSEGVAVQGRAASSSSGSRTVARSSSSTPPSTGTLTRWARDGSPTRQLRQQLQAAARDAQQMQQDRQQLQQQALQVTPASATLAKSLATIDRTLVGLRSVSPAALAARIGSTPAAVAAGASSRDAAASRHSPYSFAQGSSMGVSRRGDSGSSGDVAAGHNSGSRAAEVLAGAAAAADAVRVRLVGAKAQAAASPVSPLQRLRQQQLLLASMSAQGRQPGVQHTAVAADTAAAGLMHRHGVAASPYSSVIFQARH